MALKLSGDAGHYITFIHCMDYFPCYLGCNQVKIGWGGGDKIDYKISFSLHGQAILVQNVLFWCVAIGEMNQLTVYKLTK